MPSICARPYTEQRLAPEELLRRPSHDGQRPPRLLASHKARVHERTHFDAMGTIDADTAMPMTIDFAMTMMRAGRRHARAVKWPSRRRSITSSALPRTSSKARPKCRRAMTGRRRRDDDLDGSLVARRHSRKGAERPGRDCRIIFDALMGHAALFRTR